MREREALPRAFDFGDRAYDLEQWPPRRVDDCMRTPIRRRAGRGECSRALGFGE